MYSCYILHGHSDTHKTISPQRHLPTDMRLRSKLLYSMIHFYLHANTVHTHRLNVSQVVGLPIQKTASWDAPEGCLRLTSLTCRTGHHGHLRTRHSMLPPSSKALGQDDPPGCSLAHSKVALARGSWLLLSTCAPRRGVSNSRH